MVYDKRWIVEDRYGRSIYLTEERWQHIIEPINHPEMADYEEELQLTLKLGKRKQDPLNPRKYRYSMPFDNLPFANTHIIAIVLFSYSTGDDNEPVANNYIVTAYQKEIE